MDLLTANSGRTAELGGARVAAIRQGAAQSTHPVYAIEKARGGAWVFLCAFGGEFGRLQAGQWLAKPHKLKARYRCRCLSAGEDVTAELLQRHGLSQNAGAKPGQVAG